MARKKGNLNPIPGQRVKIVCQRERITQTCLAELIHTSEKTVSSMICGHSRVTESTAKAIVEAFPLSEYCVEWLLGLNDFMTEQEKRFSILENLFTESETRDSVLINLLMLNGWKMKIIPDKEGMGMNYVLENSKEGKMFVLDTPGRIALDKDIDGYIKHRLDCMYNDSKLRSSWDATKTMKDESR